MRTLGGRSQGQTLVGAIIGLLFLMIIVPALVYWSQQDTKATVKQEKSMKAFNLADAAVNRGFWELQANVAQWTDISQGETLPGYRFDKAYTDDPAGTYTVSIASTSDPDTVQITGIGREALKGEVREIKALYTKNIFGNVAIQAANGCSLSGSNFQVELGAVVSPQAIFAHGRAHPQYWSAVGIDLDTNGATPPNCDTPNCCQWHSYDTDVPPNPNVDLDFYMSSAAATSTHYTSAQTWKSLSYLTGYTYYIDGDLTVQSPGIYVQGNVIVMGNLNLPNGQWGTGTVTFPVPIDGWKQYCNDWSWYKTTFDAAAPGSFPGLTSGYKSDTTLTYTTGGKTMVSGFLYVKGNVIGSGGGGSGDVVGAVIVSGNVSLGSNSQARVYFSPGVAAAIRTTTLSLGRAGWKEVPASWPSGLN